MKRITIKTHAALLAALPGAVSPYVDTEFIDGTLKEIRIGDVKIRLDTYTIVITSPAPPETKPFHRVSIDLGSLGKTTKHFADDYDGREQRDRFVSDAADKGFDAEVKVVDLPTDAETDEPIVPDDVPF